MGCQSLHPQPSPPAPAPPKNKIEKCSAASRVPLLPVMETPFTTNNPNRTIPRRETCPHTGDAESGPSRRRKGHRFQVGEKTGKGWAHPHYREQIPPAQKQRRRRRMRVKHRLFPSLHLGACKWKREPCPCSSFPARFPKAPFVSTFGPSFHLVSIPVSRRMETRRGQNADAKETRFPSAHTRQKNRASNH